MKNKTKLLLLGLLLPGMAAFGQAQDNLNHNDSKTPSAQKGGTDIYGVDLYTGTSSVGIPIYSYSVDGLDLGISLNYSQKGIRVDDIATSIGLGWNLSAGGSIERTVYDVEDEVVNPVGPPTAVPSWKTRKEKVGSWASQGINNDPDQGQDVFHLNLCGKSYKFTYKMSPEPNIPEDKLYRVSPKSEIHIEIHDNKGSNGQVTDVLYPSDCNNFPFYKAPFDHQLTFYVFDEKGNKFYFEAADYEFSERAMLNDSNTKYDFRPVNKWNLSKIITYTGQEIRYFYKAFSSAGLPFYRDVEVYEKFNRTGVLGDIKVKKMDKAWQGVTYHIERIEYPNGTTAFFNFEDDDNTKWRCDNPGLFPLHDITIVGSNGLDHNAYTYQFNYAYFNSPKGSNPSTEIAYPLPCSTIANSYGIGSAEGLAYNKIGLRLKLKSIEKVGTDGITKELLYRFEYNSTALPPRFSPSRDFYGFYNGRTPVNPNPSSGCSSSYVAADLANLAVPLHTVSNFNGCGDNVSYGTDRTPDVNYMQACILARVINGSGGVTDFIFKDHVLSNPANQYNENNGTPVFTVPSNLEGQTANDGLCIDEIVINDGFSSENAIRQKYTFTGGQRFYRGGYFWYPIQLSSSADVWERVYKEHFVNPQDFYNGSNHGYSDVTQETFGFNNERIAFKKFKFSNLIDHWNPAYSNLRALDFNFRATVFRPYEFRTYRMGLLLESSDYDPVAGTLLSKSVNNYTEGPANNGMEAAAPISQDFYYTTWAGNSYGHTQGAFYIPFYGLKMRLTQSTSTQYVNGTSYSKTMAYAYDKYDNVKFVNWTDSRGIQYRKHYTFFYDHHVASNPVTEDFQQHKASESIWRINSASDSSLVSGEAVTFQATPNAQYYWIPQKIVSLKGTDLMTAANAGSALAIYDAAYYSSGTPVLQAAVENDKKYEALDSKGSITETNETQVKADVARIWDNRIGQKVAEVVNAKFVDIAYTSFEGPFAAFGTADENKGNWDFNMNHIQPTTVGGYNGGAMTGRCYYNIVNSFATINSTKVLQSGKKYLITMWASGVPTIVLNNGSQQQSVTPAEVRTVGTWKLFTVTLTPSFANGKVYVSGTNLKVDELRLHPLEATMTTTCYEPLYGPNTTCDGLNNISYQEYDVMGHASISRDIKGNIRSFVQRGKGTTDN